MEKKYTFLILFFILVAIITIAGFWNSFIQYIPNTSSYSKVIHVHFLVFSLWLILLIVQPILIKRKLTKIHRKIGNIAYPLAFFMVFTISLVINEQIKRIYPDNPMGAAITGMVGILDLISFTILFILAMYYRKNLRKHVAFFIGSTLIIFNPGLSRFVNGIVPDLGLITAVVFPFLFLFAVLFYEKWKYKRSTLKSPYLLVMLVWFLEVLIFFTVPQTNFWKNIIQAWIN